MNKRYLGALILAPFVIFIFIGGPVLKYGIMMLSLCGLFEFFNAAAKNGLKPISILSYVFCIIYFFFLNNNVLVSGKLYEYIFLSFTIVTLLLLCVPVLYPDKYNYIDVGVTILALIYVPIFFSFIPLVNMKKYGEFLVWLIFISSWMCDTSAYYTGRFFGKHKLNPKVSPKKTIEGSLGGLIGSGLTCGIYGYVVIKYGVKVELYHFISIGLICGVFTQFGDLTASSVKRHAGVKDYSNLIPGHGGILDRFDSILFASVIVYYYITIILGL